MRLRSLHALALLIVLAAACSSRAPSSDPAAWDLQEPPPSAPAEPDREPPPPVESVPGTSFSWAPDDVDVFFHRREHAASLAELEQWKKDHSEGRFELKVAVSGSMADEDRDALGLGPRRPTSDTVLWRGVGGPLLHDGLHMFECGLERADFIWMLSDHLVSCFGRSISVVFGAGEEPAHSTHVEATKLPDWMRDWYETVHLKVVDENPGGGLGLRMVKRPDYPVELPLFLYLEGVGGRKLPRYLEKYDAFMRDDVHWRLFTIPTRQNTSEWP